MATKEFLLKLVIERDLMIANDQCAGILDYSLNFQNQKSEFSNFKSIIKEIQDDKESTSIQRRTTLLSDNARQLECFLKTEPEPIHSKNAKQIRKLTIEKAHRNLNNLDLLEYIQ